MLLFIYIRGGPDDTWGDNYEFLLEKKVCPVNLRKKKIVWLCKGNWLAPVVKLIASAPQSPPPPAHVLSGPPFTDR